MAAPVNDAMPAAFAAGTTVVLSRRFGDFPAGDGWAYKLHLRGASVLDVDGEADGDAFTVRLDATATADLTPGGYRWQERLSKDGAVYNGDAGVVTVSIDMAAAEAGDAQTHNERVLALLEAAIEGRIPAGMESYQIAGRTVANIPVVDLRKLLTKYRWLVWQERNPGKLGPVRLDRFVRP